MRRFLLAFYLIFAVGCGDLTVPASPQGPQIVQRDTVFSNIAKYIDEGKVKSADQLTLMIDHLREAGNLTDAEVSAFEAALPKIRDKDRQLTQQDADAIRGL